MWSVWRRSLLRHSTLRRPISHYSDETTPTGYGLQEVWYWPKPGLVTAKRRYVEIVLSKVLISEFQGVVC